MCYKHVMDDQERLALEFLSHELSTTEGRLIDHISTTFRWLLATLFAANGGAIAALLGSDLRFPNLVPALGWFAGGVTLSLIMGSLSALMGLLAIRRYADTRAAVQQGLITGDTDHAQTALSNLVVRQKMTWEKWSPTYAGVASLACFIVGVLTVAGVFG